MLAAFAVFPALVWASFNKKLKKISYDTLENKYLKCGKCRRRRLDMFDTPSLSIIDFRPRLKAAPVDDAPLPKTNVLPNCLIIELVPIVNR